MLEKPVIRVALVERILLEHHADPSAGFLALRDLLRLAMEGKPLPCCHADPTTEDHRDHCPDGGGWD